MCQHTSHRGGAAGIRTPDLRRARAALSQTKLRPLGFTQLSPPLSRVGAPGFEPGTSALSGPRSNRLSYAPKTPGALRSMYALRTQVTLCRRRSKTKCTYDVRMSLHIPPDTVRASARQFVTQSRPHPRGRCRTAYPSPLCARPSGGPQTLPVSLERR